MSRSGFTANAHTPSCSSPLSMFRHIMSTFSTWSGPKSGRKLRCKSTIRKPVALPAISCCYVCFSCILQHITGYASNLSRHFGTHITSSSHSCLDYILTQPIASFEIPRTHSRPLQENLSGSIVSGTRAGDGSWSVVDSTSCSAYIERFGLGKRRRSPKSYDTLMTPWKSSSVNHR